MKYSKAFLSPKYNLLLYLITHISGIYIKSKDTNKPVYQREYIVIKLVRIYSSWNTRGKAFFERNRRNRKSTTLKFIKYRREPKYNPVKCDYVNLQETYVKVLSFRLSVSLLFKQHGRFFCFCFYRILETCSV